jgi:hypothetical protein
VINQLKALTTLPLIPSEQKAGQVQEPALIAVEKIKISAHQKSHPNSPVIQPEAWSP